MNISYKSIRTSCVSLLVIILILLGLLSYTVTNRVAEYDELISDNLSQLYFIMQFESQLHKAMVDVQQVISNNLVEIDYSIPNLDKLLEFSQKVQGINNKSVKELSSGNMADLHHRLRQLKLALINYRNEVRYDPSADTTLGLEKIVVEIQIQSDRIFQQFADKETHEIREAQRNLNSYIKRVHLLSINGLVSGVSLGIIVAVILTRTLSSPINKLIRGATELSKGNFDYKISIQSADEIGKLAEAFNQMGTALREKEEMRAQLLLAQFSLDNASDAAFWTNKAGRIIYANKSACHRLGYSRQDLIQRHLFDIDKNLNSDQWPDLWERVKGERRVSRDSFHSTIDGHEIPVEITTDYLCHENHEYLFMFARDCSERIESEMSRLKLERRLQRAEKMEAIGALAGGVAHDLNNILSGIVSYPELLLMEIPEDHPMRNPLMTIQQSGHKATAIVQDLLTLSRRGVSVKKVININTIIEEYLNSPEYQQLKEYHPNVTVKTDLDPKIMNIEGSPVHISKTIMNLVSNAAEAIPSAGFITILTKIRYVEKNNTQYSEIEDGDYVVLNVSDTGVGMSLEEQKKVFEPFFTKKIMGRSGTGLGMAVVWGTVKDHNGTIDINSEVDSGTNIEILFPAIRQKVSREESQPSIDQYRCRGEMVLVVDDIAEQREIASAMLNQLGYKTVAVSSGEEAIAWLKVHFADIILLDMIMAPGIDGLDTYLAVHEFKPYQKAVIASGFSETEKVRKAQQAGARHYIKKPYSLVNLGRVLQGALTGDSSES